MTATLKENLSDYLADLVQNLEPKILRGGLRAGAEVIAQGAREECRSEEVRATIGTSSRVEPGLVSAKVQTKGDGAFKAPWLEFGTDPHFISVDAAQSGGRTIKRINREVKRGSLVIGGNYVGETVHHPGAKPYPFMRQAADTRESAALSAIGSYISTRLTREGMAAPIADEPDE